MLEVSAISIMKVDRRGQVIHGTDAGEDQVGDADAGGQAGTQLPTWCS